MTREEKKILDAALLYTTHPNAFHLGKLVTAVMDLPMTQWPENACEPKKPKKAEPLPPLMVHRGAKPEPGDAAMPDKLVDLETGERKPL